jgi:hypothetical protein
MLHFHKTYNISDAILPLKIINYVNRKITSYIYLLVFTISLWIHVKHFIALTKRESVRSIFFFCNYRMPFVSSTLKSFEKWRSPLFGATGNFNHQILLYGILFLTFINTNVFYLPSFKLTY